jgi:proteasome assembly chaperone (PAC2) family protein
MKGFCLLGETQGFYPDASAAHEVLNAISRMLHLNVDMNRLETAAETTREILRSFGMESQPPEEKANEEPSYRWHV